MAVENRPIYVVAEEICPGDLVDLSTTVDPYWIEVVGITHCDEDDEWQEHCDYDGHCDLVLLFGPPRENGDPATWHLVRGQFVNAVMGHWVDDAGRAHSSACDGEHTCPVCGGSWEDGPCPECQDSGEVPCLGCFG